MTRFLLNFVADFIGMVLAVLLILGLERWRCQRLLRRHKAQLRHNRPVELLEAGMVAHKGTCQHCGGLVKMMRNDITYVLEPSRCWCLQCGQRYRVEIDDMEAWARQQWRQKEQNLS